MANTKPNSNSVIIIIAILAIVVIAAFMFLNAPDRRTPGDKISDAANSVSDGITDAGRSLQDRTPAQKLGDAAEDAGDKIERATE